MEMANAARVELPRELGGDGGGDQLPGCGQIVEPFEQVVQPLRDGRSAALGEATRGRDVRDWKDARHDFGFDSGRCRFVAEAEEAVRRKEELCDRPVRAGVDLALQILEIEDTGG